MYVMPSFGALATAGAQAHKKHFSPVSSVRHRDMLQHSYKRRSWSIPICNLHGSTSTLK